MYAASGTTYYTYVYSASGLTPGISTNTGHNLALYDDDRIQLISGLVYTDYGTVLNAESGSLAGTLGTGATSGPTPAAIDASLGLAFILGSVQYATVSNQIQLFNPSNFTSTGTAAIPVNVASYTPAALSSDLTRWGTNGLAFRNSLSVYVLRSNLVKDLSASPADLGVTLTSSGSNTTGSQLHLDVATISNAGPSSASEVELTAPLLSTGVLVAATPSSGSCSTATNVSCDLGTLGSGATATVSG